MVVVEEKIIAVERREVEIKEIQTFRDRIVEKDKLIQKTDTKNYIQTEVKTVELVNERVVPVFSTV